jgi:hypothetical protein
MDLLSLKLAEQSRPAPVSMHQIDSSQAPLRQATTSKLVGPRPTANPSSYVGSPNLEAALRSNNAGVKYDRKAKVFSAIVLGICKSIIRYAELKDGTIFTLAISDNYKRLTSIIEAIVRVSVPPLKLPDVLNDANFLKRIQRNTDNDVLNISHVTIKEMAEATTTGNIYRSLIMVVKHLKQVAALLPLPMNDVITHIGPAIVEDDGFDIDPSLIKSRQLTALEAKCRDLSAKGQTNVVEEVVSGLFTMEESASNQTEAGLTSKPKKSKRAQQSGFGSRDGAAVKPKFEIEFT